MGSILAIDPGCTDSAYVTAPKILARNRAWYAKHREERVRKMREYRQANLEKERERAQSRKPIRNAAKRDWPPEKKAVEAAKMREYRRAHPDRIKGTESRRIRPDGYKDKVAIKFREYSREYERTRRQRSPEQIQKSRIGEKRWRDANPDKRLAQSLRRRAAIQNVAGDLTSAEICAIRKAQKGTCFYCSSALDNQGRGHVEHKTPLSRGGRHTASNVVIACSICNLRKGTMTAEEFIRRRSEAAK